MTTTVSSPHWLCVSVTFFPAFVTIAQGLQLVPRAAFDLTRVYGANWRQELVLVAVPSALPYVFAALRLAVPRALLGVMIAEWLATGVGLGNLLLWESVRAAFENEGVECFDLVAVGNDPKMLAAYQGVGFELLHDLVVYEIKL